MELLRPAGRPPMRVGHRGAAARAPENTLAGFNRALELGVDAIEFDVLPLADGTLVLAHSDDLAELTHGAAEGRVGMRTLGELRALAPQLPTFDEALEHLAREAPRTVLQVDVKWIGYEADVVEALRRHGVVERTFVSSFFSDSLRTIGRLEPALPLGLTYPLDRRGLSRRRELAPVVLALLAVLRRTLPYRVVPMLEEVGASVATLHWLVVSRAVVERCHASGIAVFAWTVNDPRAAERLARQGVDGVISDDPGIFHGTLGA